MPMISTDIAWAAGLFEGEGCFYEVRNGRTIHLGLAIEMTDEEIIRRFYDVLAKAGATGRSHVTTRWRGNNKHARQYALKMTGSPAERAFTLMRLHLGSRRIARVEEILTRRAATLYALIETRTCQGCDTTFTTTPRSTRRTWCSLRCYQRVTTATPEGRAAANERSRRHRQRKRAIPGTSPHAIR